MIHTDEDRANAVQELEKLGYKVEVEQIDEDTYKVFFQGKYSIEPHTLKVSYGTCYTPNEIKQDQIYNLARWANIHKVGRWESKN